MPRRVLPPRPLRDGALGRPRHQLGAARQTRGVDPAPAGGGWYRDVRQAHSGGASLAVEKTALLPNAPNPFSGATPISYQFTEQQPVTIAIYALLVQPQLVRLGSALWTDTVRPYLSLEIGAAADCYPQKVV